jgi:putative transcriptional regulator
MTPRRHVPLDLLLAYSAGGTDEATALVVATHLVLCPTCRADNDALDAAAGALLARTGEAPVADGMLEAILGKLDAPAPIEPPIEGLLPRPILRYLAEDDRTALPWRPLLPGAEEIRLPLARNGVPARLTRTRGGFVLPRHTHAGLEMTLVLSGGFEDRGEHYTKGDLSLGDPSVTHTIRFDRGEPCIALVVNDARLVPKGPFSNLVALFVDF